MQYSKDLKLYYKTKLPACQTYCRSKFNLVLKSDKISSVRNRSIIFQTSAFDSLEKSIIETEHIALDDIFNSEAKCFLIEGEQGVGKTELVQHLCCKWEEVGQLKKFVLVILLDLKNKHVQDINCFEEMFDPTDISVQLKVSQEVCSRKGEDVMIMLDGFDKLPQSITKNHESFFMKLIDGKYLPKSTKLITGTPHSIRLIIGNYQILRMRHIKILGPHSSEFGYSQEASSYLKGIDKQEMGKPNSEVFSRDQLLSPPLLTAASDQPEVNVGNYSIPITFTQYYVNYFLTLLCNYLKTTSLEVDALSLQDLKAYPMIHKKLLTISNLALMGILVKNSSLSDHLSRDPDMHLGVMYASCTHCKDSVLEVHFQNSNLQEFLAAYFISSLEEHERDEVFLLNPFSELCGVWKFVAGLTGFTHTMLDVFKSYIKDSMSLVHIVSLLHELQDENAIQHVFKGHQVLSCCFKSLKESKDFMSRCYEVGYCIATSTCQWMLDFSCCNLNYEDLNAFVAGMKAVKNVNGSIKSLRLDYNHMTDDKILLLSELSLKEMTCISLISCNLTPKSFNYFISSIKLMPKLKSLNIGHNSACCDNLVAKLLSNLTTPMQLEELHIEGTALSYDDVLSLNTLLTLPGRNLVELSIGGKFMSSESVHLLVDTVLSQSSIQVLHISDVDLTLISDSLTFLETNLNLTRLVFFECHLQLTKLATSLCMNTTLKELDIFFPLNSDDEDMGLDATVSFSDMLEVNSSLTALSLYSFKQFGSDKVLKLIEPLNYNQTLENLQLPSHFAMHFSRREFEVIDPRVSWNEWPCIPTSTINH